MLVEVAKEWLGTVSIVIAIGSTIYVWLMSRTKVNEEHLKSVDKDLVDHDRRIQAVEGELKHLPAKDDVNDLKIAMAEMKGAIGRIDETMNGLGRSIRRVEDYLQGTPKK